MAHGSGPSRGASASEAVRQAAFALNSKRPDEAERIVKIERRKTCRCGSRGGCAAPPEERR